MFNISFQFDEETKKVSNVKVEEIKSKDSLLEGAFVTVAASKLELTKDAANLLGVKAGDKVSVRYLTVDNEHTYPLIGKSEVFDDAEGNKLTKSLTVSFRGDQRKMLLEYGSVFKVTATETEGRFKLEAQETEKVESAETAAVAEANGKLDNFVGLMDLKPVEGVPQAEFEDGVLAADDDLPF